MKHSIKKQFALIFILLMSGVVFFCWLANTLFLEKYYLRMKTKVIYDAFVRIQEAAADDSYDSEGFREELEKICQNSNISAVVINEEAELEYVSSNGGERLKMMLMGYLLGFEQGDVQVLLQEEDAEHQLRIQRARMNNGGFLEMYGRLSSGVSFIMSTPLESIRESAKMANTFYFYTGAFGTIIGVLIIWFVTGKIIRPILTLNQISERMVKLDFDAKYTGKTQNEIGLLGENMNRLSSSLEHSISELKSANNKLRLDIEKMEKVDERRREFLASVSHELKTPIALIQGYAEGLQVGMGDTPEERDYYCEVIVDEAQKMNQMVQKLLSLNELEAGNENIELERFDVTTKITEWLENGMPLLKQQEIKVEWEPTGNIHVWGDVYKTEEVFHNYFSNAVHYCKGERRIRIDLAKVEDKIRISVFNTGDPIPEDSLPRVWEKFYKVDKARTREYGGSGVGLSIVKAIMNSMNQAYGVENVEGGVVFWFELESAETAL